MENIFEKGNKITTNRRNCFEVIDVNEHQVVCRGIKFSDIKRYYGLKGRSAKDCLPQFEKIMADYKAELNKPSIEEIL